MTDIDYDALARGELTAADLEKAAETSDAKPEDQEPAPTGDGQEAEDVVNAEETAEATSDGGEEGNKPDPADDEAKSRRQRQRETRRQAIDALARQKSELEAKLARVTAPEPIDFDEIDDEFEAAAVKAAQRVAKQNAEAEKAQLAEQAKALEEQSRQQIVDTFRDNAEDFKKSAADFDVKYNAALVHPNAGAVSPDVSTMIHADDTGPAVMYELGNDPAHLTKMATMSPVQQAAYVAKMQAKAEIKAADRTREVSKAPPPAKTVASSGSTRGFDVSRLSNDQKGQQSYEKWLWSQVER